MPARPASANASVWPKATPPKAKGGHRMVRTTVTAGADAMPSVIEAMPPMSMPLPDCLAIENATETATTSKVITAPSAREKRSLSTASLEKRMSGKTKSTMATFTARAHKMKAKINATQVRGPSPRPSNRPRPSGRIEASIRTAFIK